MKRIRNVACLAAGWSIGAAVMTHPKATAPLLFVVGALVTGICLWYTREDV